MLDKVISRLNNPVEKNIIANFYKIIVLFVNQILLIPLYLKFWGVDIYADWIVLTAIVGFFTMSDAGINNATTNRFCIKFAQNERQECNSLIVNNYLIISIAAILVFLVVIGCVLFCDIKTILSLNTFTNKTVGILLPILTSQIFVQMYSTVQNAVYYSNHLASRATYLDNTARLFNAIAILIGIVLHLTIELVAFLGIIPYIASFIFKLFDSKKYFRVNYKMKYINKALLKEIFIPSVSYLSFPIGNAFIFQCFTLIVNSYIGPVGLVAFNTTRTMANFVRSMVQAIAHGIKPEFSIAYGEMDVEKLKKLLRKGFYLCLGLALLACLLIEIVGEPIYIKWTAGKIHFDRILVSIFLVITIVNALWESTGISMTAINKHTKLGIVYLFSTLLSAFCAYISTFMLTSIYLIASTILLSDIIMAVYSIKHCKSIMQN